MMNTKRKISEQSYGLRFWQSVPRVVGSGVRMSCCTMPHHRLELAFWRISLDRALDYIVENTMPVIESSTQGEQLTLF